MKCPVAQISSVAVCGAGAAGGWCGSGGLAPTLLCGGPKAAFDNAFHDTLWALLSADWLPTKAVQLLQRFCSGTACSVRLGGHSLSNCRSAARSNPPFNVLMDRVLRETVVQAGSQSAAALSSPALRVHNDGS